MRRPTLALILLATSTLCRGAHAQPRTTAQAATEAREAQARATAADHADMMRQLGIIAMRPGPSGDPTAPNAANTNEANATPFQAFLNPSSVQADNGAGLTRGIIGLTNRGARRRPDDWGALRAWAWGASRALDYLEGDPAVDASRVAIEGVSRYGKAALVTMAFDTRFAGAWSVDSHSLIALCAPRRLFLSHGIPEKGDAHWIDARGAWMAALAAQPVWRLLGARDLGVAGAWRTTPMPPVNAGLLDGNLAWRQHDGGHTDAPNWKPFIAWASR